jgi:hypothetical protein
MLDDSLIAEMMNYMDSSSYSIVRTPECGSEFENH